MTAPDQLPTHEGDFADSKMGRVLSIERIDADIYRGRAVPSMLGRTFGGQVAAQALMAATATVTDGKRVNSLHGYFMAGGDPDQPIVFRVERLRDGRSFSTRQVIALQDGQAIFTMSASYHVPGEEGLEHHDTMAPVTPPEEIYFDPAWLPRRWQKLLEEWSNWEIKPVLPGTFERNPYAAAQQKIWFRCKDAIPADHTVQVATLTYMSDMTLLGVAKVPHGKERVQEASLDHALWFLRDVNCNEWLLYDQTSPSAQAGRALTRGRIFDKQGRLVAVATQEGLARKLGEGQVSIPLKEDAAATDAAADAQNSEALRDKILASAAAGSHAPEESEDVEAVAARAAAAAPARKAAKKTAQKAAKKAAKKAATKAVKKAVKKAAKKTAKRAAATPSQPAAEDSAPTAD